MDRAARPSDRLKALLDHLGGDRRVSLLFMLQRFSTATGHDFAILERQGVRFFEGVKYNAVRRQGPNRAGMNNG
jgi:hypothetical protein